MGENLVAGILKSIETKVELSIKIGYDVLTAVKTTNNILSKQIGGELKKQTKLLTAILRGIGFMGKNQESTLTENKKGDTLQGYDVLTAVNTTNNILSEQIGGELKKQTKLLTAILRGIGFMGKIQEATLKENKKGDTLQGLLGVIADDKKMKQFAKVPKVIEQLAAAIRTLVDSMELITPRIIIGFNRFLRIADRLLEFSKNLLLAGLMLTVAVAITLPALIIFITFFLLVFAFGRMIRKGSLTLLYASIVFAIIVGIMAFTLFLLLTDPVAFTKNMSNLLVALTMLVLFYVIVGFEEKFVLKGVKTMMLVAITIGIILLSIWFAVNMLGGFGEILLGVLMIVFALFIIQIAFILAASIAKTTKKGAKAMLMIALSIALIFGVLFLVTNFFGGALETAQTIFWISVALLIQAEAYKIIGEMAKIILKGALVMILVSIVFWIITDSIVNFKKARVKLKDIAMVLALVVGLGLAMAAAGTGPVPAFIGLGAAVMLVAAAALWVMTDALLNFKKSKWKPSDTKNLSKTLFDIVAIFPQIFTAIPITEWRTTKRGIRMLADIGEGISAIAEGLAAFSKLNLIEYEYDNDGKVIGTNTKGKLDPKAIGKAITDLITPLVGANGPLAQLGKGNEGWFSTSSVAAGIDLLADLGESLGSFAEGMMAFANLEFVGMVNEEGKPLQVDNSKKVKVDPAKIAQGITTLVSPLVGSNGPLAKLGKDEGAIFSGPVGRGIGLLGDLGGAIGDFADGLQNIANLKIPAYELVKGTGGTTGIPARYKKIPNEFTTFDATFAKKVGSGIKFLLNSLTTPLESIGKKSGNWFNSSDMDKGVDFLKNIGDPIHQFSEAIKVIADMNTGEEGKSIEKNLMSMINPLNTFFGKENLGKLDDRKGKKLLGYTTDYLEQFSSFGNNTDIQDMFVTIKESINGLDELKIDKLNNLIVNLNKFTQSLDDQFDDLIEVLETLKETIEEMNSGPDIGDKLVSFFKNPIESLAGEVESGGRTKGSTSTETAGGKLFDIQAIIDGLGDINNTLRGGIEVQPKGGSSLFG